MSTSISAFRDVDAFIEMVKRSGFFDPGKPILMARAPGRLDVMGGIADYSGSLVLQRPIAEATFAAIQRTDDSILEFVSVSVHEQKRTGAVRLSHLAPSGEPIPYDAARRLFSSSGNDRWLAYVAGVFLVLMREIPGQTGLTRNSLFPSGAKIFISSAVPESKGVASSAALEVAVMRAVCGAYNLEIPPQEIALLCQKAENLVAAAPCGVMDQMTAACGEAATLVALLCQPAILQTPVRVPDEIRFWGLDSGERHAVSGSDYTSVRTAAFMGYRIMAQRGFASDGYLVNIGPGDFEREFIESLPDEMTGAEFLASYSGTIDTVTSVDPSRIYRVRQATAHPIYEHDRIQRFRKLLHESGSEHQRTLLGDAMYESHKSYSDCGLGSRGTDLIVNLVRTAGRAKGLYGARITGGGSGGTVVILGRSDAGGVIKQIVENYTDATGYRPHVFSGSSPGAASFGVRHVTI